MKRTHNEFTLMQYSTKCFMYEVIYTILGFFAMLAILFTIIAYAPDPVEEVTKHIVSEKQADVDIRIAEYLKDKRGE